MVSDSYPQSEREQAWVQARMVTAGMWSVWRLGNLWVGYPHVGDTPFYMRHHWVRDTLIIWGSENLSRTTGFKSTNKIQQG